MRTKRIRSTFLAAAATAALALSLTACGGSDGDGGKSAKADSDKSAGATTSGGNSAADKGSSEDSGNGSGTSGGSGSGQTKDQAAAGTTATQPCKGDELSISVLHRFPAEEGEHLLITAQNADSKACWVTSYPSVMLGDTATVLGHSADDAAGGTAKITVKPGGKVYSAVALFVDGESSHTSSALSIALRDQGGDTGPGYENGAADDQGGESEFTWDSAEVTNWNTEKPYNF
ncbi:DUF4232 domain-containing protein [Streptomyces sp. TRM66268-LWL]|uniref:DUF4232 domain-containing protein n=1 Tax=Streptomyces polyasparticus TaxID=2767826 RepID=A0ABR7SRN5_9ACTN|nr:DUF4232 domain-containing protein [Streptomyces polyasparticus]MBC9717252.1 DUF4232 domain-containing protein [Streptomyces polyasparticus]